MMSGIFAPVVLVPAARSTDPPVLLLEVSSGDPRPARVCRTEVDSIGRVAALVAGHRPHRREFAPESYLLDQMPIGRDVHGRSCALAMALESLRAFYGLTLAFDVVVATGTVDATGKVEEVDYLESKLEKAFQGVRARKALVLVPQCQLPEGSAPSRLSAAMWKELQARCSGPIVAVDALHDAANHAFGLKGREELSPSELGKLAMHLETLRYSTARRVEMFAVARDLYQRVRNLAANAPGSALLMFHALIAAWFALSDPGCADLRFADIEETDREELRRALESRAEALLQTQRSRISAELIAEWMNFRATRAFGSHDFSRGVEDALRGLRTPGLHDGHEGEHRKLLGTLGQLRSRRALRLAAVGLSHEAAFEGSLACDDLEHALELATGDVAEQNDRARVRVYLAAARGVRERVVRDRPWNDSEVAELLGRFWPGAGSDAGPVQDARWALEVLYGVWSARGRWSEIVDHFRSVAALRTPIDGSEECPLLDAFSACGLPCDARILARVAEASLRAGDHELLARVAEVARPPHGSAEIARCHPRARAIDVPALVQVRAWMSRTVEIPLPHEPLARGWIDELRDPGSRRTAHARRKLLQWLGILPPAARADFERRIFVARESTEVPAGVGRFLSVDGTVPGYALRYDHHVSGEVINLDAMPETLALDELGIDAIGTTNADADAVTSVVAALFGGKAELPSDVRAVFEAASHWCDHLAPHPHHDEVSNRRGRGLLGAITRDLKGHNGAASTEAFATTCRELARCVEERRPLPELDDSSESERRAREWLAAGWITFRGDVAVVDGRDRDPLDPAATYEVHDKPMAVFVTSHPHGGHRYTVGTNPRVAHRARDLRAALAALANAEFAHGPPCAGPTAAPGDKNWGGRATVFGSPWNYGSRLSIEEVVELVQRQAG